MTTTVLAIHYANANDLAKFIGNQKLHILSERGSVHADTRTNSIWIKDMPAIVKSVKQLIRSLDIPVKQVLIKARIVDVDDQYTQSLGVLFKAHAQQTNNPNQMIMDLPSGAQGLGGMTLPIIKLSDTILLDLQLKALEQAGHAKIISSPQLMASNRSSAEIEAGEEVPFQQQNNNGGTSVAFKKAVLRLKVTPEIMPHQQLLLHLTVNQDKISTLQINGVPAINTRKIVTQVLVHNQQTFVIGGIFESAQSQQQQGVPGLQRIPLLGALFREKQRLHQRKQLLIFVTPIIIH